MKEIITSRQNPQVRLVCSLADKKKRRQEELFRFDGIKLFIEAMACRTQIEAVFVREPMNVSVRELVDEYVRRGMLDDNMIVRVSESVFDKISEERAPEGIITVAKHMKDLHMRSDSRVIIGHLREGERLLIAESLRDPGNMGTIMRSCAALGIDRLIVSSDSAEIYNPKVVRGAMGALFHLPTITVDIDDMPACISVLRSSGRRVFAAALCEGAAKVGEISLKNGDCFVIGNEGHGLSRAVIEACDQAAIIPMREGNESLNAAAAAAICIWETVRAR